LLIGVIREHRREKAGISKEKRFPKIDLNDDKQRRAFSYITIITLLLILLSAFGSFKAYEYTESDEFCGTLCHKVMEPEYTAYLSSPHARVGCVQCHIGSGADWFVKSKLSGSYQVYSVLFNKYSKPIPTPIQDLRPARETCERCHWPEHFFSEKKHVNTYFLSDEENTKQVSTILMKIGGGSDETGITEGIHWHMNIANEITYAATDSSRMEIPWVMQRSRDGKETIYRDNEFDFSEFNPDNALKRKMDCMDCHNRPSHIYHPPMESVNNRMAGNLIDTTLPYIKSITVQALENRYTEKSIALDSIRIVIESFYRENYPDIFNTKKDVITGAVKQTQQIYSRNYFPYMNVSWKEFPDQIGHMYAPGCFRCHDGKHVSDDGKVISNDCNSCHTIIGQQTEGTKGSFSLTGLEFEHPVDIGESWRDNCTDCHSGK
jgi:nitrate/TMAO reductase-like tetraheme cytochrome c subunit